MGLPKLLIKLFDDIERAGEAVVVRHALVREASSPAAREHVKEVDLAGVEPGLIPAAPAVAGLQLACPFRG